MRVHWCIVLALLCCVAAQQQAKVGIEWGGTNRTTSHMLFGTNDFYIDQYQENDGESYRTTLRNLGLSFFRFHNEGLADKWSVAETRTWNATMIKIQFDNYVAVYGNDFPTVIMTIPKWPQWLSPNATLDLSLYPEYAKFCAELVQILNIDQGRNITYWEPSNELDIPYRAADKMPEMYALYNISSYAMKEVDPSIQVGGPAWAGCWASETVYFFKESGPNIAFVSWHMYIAGASSLQMTNASILASTLNYVPMITSMQQVINTRPGTLHFLDEYNVFYDYHNVDSRLYTNLGAVWYASMHRIIAESGLDGASNWNARDPVFGLIDGNDKPRPPAYIFKWSNNYFIGNMASSTSSDDLLEVLAVANNKGASVYLINKDSSPMTVVVAQNKNYFGNGAVLLNKINTTGVYEGLSIQATSLSSGVTLEPESVWCISSISE